MNDITKKVKNYIKENFREILEYYWLEENGSTLFFCIDENNEAYTILMPSCSNPENYIAYINIVGLNNLDSNYFYEGWTEVEEDDFGNYIRYTELPFLREYIYSIEKDPDDIDLKTAARVIIQNGDIDDSDIDDIIDEVIYL